MHKINLDLFQAIFYDLWAHFRQYLVHNFKDIGFLLLKILRIVRVNAILLIAS